MVVPQEVALAAWWARTYHALAADLGFSLQDDHDAALLLDRLLDARDAIPLRESDIHHRGPVVVVGAADSLPLDIAARPPERGERVFAADGALTGILDAGHEPHLVVSDLDGDLPRLVEVNANGVPVAVHAHGDNMDRLREWVPKLPGWILGTRQTPGPAPSRLVTPGGLGDGDRAVFLAHRLGATRIRLVGFDLHGAPGRLSHHTDPERKRRKMAWSARILADAHRLGLPLEEEEGHGRARTF